MKYMGEPVVHKGTVAVVLALGMSAVAIACDAQSPARQNAVSETPARQITAAAITAADLRTRVFIFADDSMQGRRAGSEGNRRATDYIASELRRLGVQPAGDS